MSTGQSPISSVYRFFIIRLDEEQQRRHYLLSFVNTSVQSTVKQAFSIYLGNPGMNPRRSLANRKSYFGKMETTSRSMNKSIGQPKKSRTNLNVKCKGCVVFILNINSPKVLTFPSRVVARHFVPVVFSFANFG